MYNTSRLKVGQVISIASMNEQGRGKSAGLRRLAWAALPIAISLLPLWVVTQEQTTNPTATVAACGAGCVVLWLGWSSIRRNIVTKWGGLLAIFLSLVVGLFLFGIVVKLSFPVFRILSVVLYPLLLVALPYLVYTCCFARPTRAALPAVVPNDTIFALSRRAKLLA